MCRIWDNLQCNRTYNLVIRRLVPLLWASPCVSWPNPTKSYDQRIADHAKDATHKSHRNSGFTSSLALLDLPLSYPAPTGLV